MKYFEPKEFLQQQIDGIEKAISEGKIFNTEETLRQRQKEFQAVMDHITMLENNKK